MANRELPKLKGCSFSSSEEARCKLPPVGLLSSHSSRRKIPGPRAHEGHPRVGVCLQARMQGGFPSSKSLSSP